jgi:hypothetical protein
VSGPAGDELDRLLAEWGGRSRLAAAEEEEVRLAVVTSRPEGLDAGWWSALAGQVSAVVIQATALPEASRSALRMGWSQAAWATAP